LNIWKAGLEERGMFEGKEGDGNSETENRKQNSGVAGVAGVQEHPTGKLVKI
jgi:hypothetical protein